MQIIQILNVIGLPLLFLIMFVIAYKINRTKLITGFLFTCFLFLSILIFFANIYISDNVISKYFLILCFILALFLLSFGVYIFISLLFLNAKTIVKRESGGLSHRLTLVFAVGLILLIIIHKLMDILDLPQILRSLFISIDIVIFYYFFHMSQYILTTFLCNLSHPKKNKDYIIVLGCGLKDGNVTTLLAKRVEKAVQFYNKQKLKTKPPKLVFAGGQGADEPRPESQAMAEYAISKGASKDDFILESKSTSTKENMNFSKELMDEDSKGNKYNAIYVTSNFHILRAGIYAHKAGLKINGIGSKTAFYYFPNALLREYAAYLFMYIKWNIGLTIFMIVFGTVFFEILFNSN